MDGLRIEIEPQTVCRCGGKILPMSAKEREEYDAIVREIEQRLRTAKPTGDEAVNIKDRE